MYIYPGDQAQPNPSLNAVTATGAGATRALKGTRQAFGIQVTATGAPTTVVVALQGSLDGTTWFTIGTWTKVSQAFGDIVFVTGSPVLFIRPNLTSLSGGTSPTVSVYISAI